MKFKDNESEEHFVVILIFAVILGVIALTLAGWLPREDTCPTTAYWDGTHYTCHP